MHAHELVGLDATDLSQAIHRRELSCLEVMQAHLAQIDALNPQVNALVARVDADHLLEQSRMLDDELQRGQSRGPLHGFPLAPKDLSAVKGLVTSRGSPLFAQNVTQEDAVFLARLRTGGCVFVGRSNTPEFGLGGHTYNPVYGLTRNAWNPERSAGGSSGGAAVAVALHMLPVADGTDMMGSLRTPAAFNHVYGFRPTPNLIPNGPADEVFQQQFAVAGPMARNVRDLAMTLGVMQGFDARLPLSRRFDRSCDGRTPLARDMQGCRIGWLGNLNGRWAMDPGLLATQAKALDVLRDIGCVVDEASLDTDLDAAWRAWITLRSAQFAGANQALWDDADKRAQLKPEALWEMEQGRQWTSLQLYNAAKARSAFYQAMRALFERFDFLVLPATQVAPFPAEWDWPHHIDGRAMDTYHRWLACTVPATLASLPALSAPAGFDAQGLPAGIQIVGPTQADWSVLQLGHAYQQASPWSAQRSPLLG
ncbi:amidase [Comamonas serinivorans]|uniref:Amidase n=1 Tax=Comamonas serinivorans TaxID=1082851 RepID=A0A1Y0EIZ4_9BURK|nr:amidase [Comamonas serinivorans]ARU03613.1 amidase [Comamonas serinivorans]